METSTSTTAKGLLRSLYDFGFTSLIATKVLRFVYALGVIVYSILAAIAFIVAVLSVTKSAVGGIIGIILIPIGYLISLIWLRIIIEVLIVFFGIGDDVRVLRARAVDTNLVGVPARSTVSELPATSPAGPSAAAQTLGSEPIQPVRPEPIQTPRPDPISPVHFEATPSSPPEPTQTNQAVPAEPAQPAAATGAVEPAPTAQTPAAGWYEAPGDSTQYRYWDGGAWTQHFMPKAGST